MTQTIGFAHPAVLLLLIVPAWLLAWTWRREGRRVVLPFDHGRQRPGRRWSLPIRLAECLPALALAGVVILIAGPQRLGVPLTRRALTNIEFCVDVSGSMTAPFGEGTRYDASMKAIDQFLDFREGDAFGLTFFGNNVLHWVPLTNDVSAIKFAPPFMRPEVAPPWFGGTEIGKALLACKKILEEREEGDRLIVLVSDGYSFDLANGNEEGLAKQLREAGVTVFTIHTAETEIPGEIVNLTAGTGGEAFAAGDPASLEIIFKRIDEMTRAKLEKTAPETLDHFAPFCIAALSVLGTMGLTSFGLRYNPW